jgi:hypothetical protein
MIKEPNHEEEGKEGLSYRVVKLATTTYING